MSTRFVSALLAGVAMLASGVAPARAQEREGRARAHMSFERDGGARAERRAQRAAAGEQRVRPQRREGGGERMERSAWQGRQQTQAQVVQVESQRGGDWRGGDNVQRQAGQWSGQRADRPRRDWGGNDLPERARAERYDRRDGDRGGWNERQNRAWSNGAGQWRGDDRGWRNNRGGWDRNSRGGWSRDWRRNNRYNWSGYRAQNRSAYRLPRYYAPYGWNSGYRRFGIGITLSNVLFAQDYWIADPWSYRLPDAYGPYRWVRYYNDALLVDVYSGEVVDVVYDIFW